MYIPKTLSRCAWWQFYDILEETCLVMRQKWGPEYLPTFMEKVNPILAKEGIPWVLEDGRVVRKLHPQAAAPIQQTHALLANPKFKGPDEQFAKAIEHLNKRPEPDKENCVKDAVGAIEGVANILAGTHGIQLNNLLDRELFRSNIDRTITQAIEKLYAYRGTAPGAAHGQVGPATVGIEEATWVLTTSAATILYLIGKF